MIARREALAEFSGLLRKLREKAGYSSGRDFYRSSGGRGYFRCTYEQYLNVEKGRSVSSPGLVEKLSVALRLGLDEDSNRRFFLAYLRLLLGSDDLLALVRQAVSAPHAGVPPLRQAIQRDIESKRRRITPALAQLMYANEVSYWLSTVFCNDEREWAAGELALTLGYSESSVIKALKEYVKAGFLKPSRDGRRYRCPAAGSLLLMPRQEPHSDPEKRGRLSDRLIEDMTRRRGGQEMRQTLFLRSSSAALRQYYPYLAQTVMGSGIYSAADPGPDTALYVVQCAVRRLFPF